MGKFLTNLTASNKEIKEARAKLVNKSAEQACKDEINAREKRIRDLQSKLMDLEDLSPESTVSLKPVSGDFNAESWAKSIIETTINLKLEETELAIVKGILSEYFE